MSDVEYLTEIIDSIYGIRDCILDYDLIKRESKETKRRDNFIKFQKELTKRVLELTDKIGTRLITIAQQLGEDEPASWGLPFIREVSAIDAYKTETYGLSGRRVILLEEWRELLAGPQLPSQAKEVTPATEVQYDHLADVAQPIEHGNNVVWQLVSMYTKNTSDERIGKVTQVVNDPSLNVNEKLSRIDRIIKIPPSASARILGKVLNVSHPAIINSSWWLANRKGRRDDEVALREARYIDRAKSYESKPEQW